LISVFPFDLILEYGHLSKVVRFTRIGKIYRLIKITKMVRLVKTAQVRSKISILMNRIFKLGDNLQRIIYIFFTFFILQHVTACIW